MEEDALTETINEVLSKVSGIFPDEPGYPALRSLDNRFETRVGRVERSKPLTFGIDSRFRELFALIDRCLQTRNAKMELEAKAMEAGLADIFFVEQSAIRQKQIDDGLFAVAVLEAKNASAMHAQSLAASLATEAKATETIRIRTIGDPLYEASVIDAREAAFASATYRDQVVRTTSERLTRTRIEVERISAEQAAAALAITTIQSNKMSESSDARAILEVKNENHKKDLFDSEIANANRRRVLSQHSDSGLNYQQRLSELFHLFNRDYMDALVRAQELEHILENILGIDVNFNFDRHERPLTELAIAVRDAGSRTAALLRSEFETTICHSIHRLVGDRAWEDFKNGEKIPFEITHTMFRGLSLVRIRSIQLRLKGTGRRISVRIRLPAVGTVAISTGRINNVDQSGIPAVLVGDVGHAEPPESRGIVSSQSIHDASPLGQWVVQLMDQPEYPFEDIELFIGIAACDAGIV